MNSSDWGEACFVNTFRGGGLSCSLKWGLNYEALAGLVLLT